MLYVISKIRGKLSSKARKGPNSASERAKSSRAPASTALTTITTEATKHTEAIGTNSLSWNSLDCTDDLWNRAYTLVQGREPELMEEYRRQIAVVHQEDGQAAGTDLTCRKSVESLVKHLLDHRENRRWRISLLGKDVTLRRQVERLTKFLIWSDPIVKTAVCTQPYAALAWSGVSTFVALLSSGATQGGTMLKGFNYTTDLQIYWQVCEESYFKSENNEGHYLSLVEPLAKLYSYIVEYQARTICYLSGPQKTRAWRSMTGSNDWSATIEQIKKQDQVCRDILGPVEAKITRDTAARQLQQMQESQTILHDIRKILREGENQAKKVHEDEAERALLQDLTSAFSDSSRSHAESSCEAQYAGLESYKNLNPERVPGTCEWFFKDERFCNWRASESSSLLWVSAGPGCGKSVLSRALIDEDRLSIGVTTSNICYFFFKEGDSRRMHSTNALCALLYQLLEQDDACDGKNRLLQQALGKHRALGASLTRDFFELWEIIEDYSKLPEAGETVCLLDALDECDRDSSEQLVNALRDFYCSPAATSSKLKFLITSRQYDYLAALFDQFSPTVYVQFDGNEKSEDINREIDIVIDYRVKELSPYLSMDDQRKISDRLKQMENRTYLWLYLIFDIMRQNPSIYSKRSRIENLLQSIPSKVSDAYERILSSSPDEKQTEIMLQIILAAERPLSPSEMNVALTLALQDAPFESQAQLESDLWPGTNFKSVVENLCGLFVTHYILQEATAARQLQNDAIALCTLTDPRTEPWTYYCLPYNSLLESDSYGIWSGLPMATYLGFTDVVRALLDSRSREIVQDDDKHGTALCVASLLGHTQILQILLDHFVPDVPSRRTDLNMARYFASMTWNDDIMKLLDEAGRYNHIDAGGHNTHLGEFTEFNQLLLRVNRSKLGNAPPFPAVDAVMSFRRIWRDELVLSQEM
ncbi:hypothetical protein AtubIFM56815_004700 [Aspergillus tubingensis]|uniref:NWD NACHT-NTPase N-terminal domain-containing protein n=1 Tax=Aspergillus tubingensis TaxID=5068 RepID=A0A9W6AH87_ASPTU|nr:hypothetical protein AtubIFM56815_004700 [Aspergillus tubingensis]GLB17827.1 hypothetical protein AtubIFM61612_007716 [Aspergillus tubingensis]